MPSDAPRFSIVIPTRNRGHLLPFALQSALEQEFDDFEIVVVANDCSDNTRDVVREMHDPRVHYFESPTMLSMPDNWGYAWTKARGTYVTYLSDDDALVPTALSSLTQQAMQDNPPIISWEDAVYYYPNWHDPQLRNLLLLFHHSDTLIEDVPTAFYRNLCARFEFPWQSTLPKMLNCVAHRTTLDTWREKLGRLFPPICPDYSFGLIASHAFERIRVMHRPLSVRGISDISIGSNAGLGDAGRGFLQEFDGIDFFSDLPTRVPTTMNLLAATFLRVNAMLREQEIAHEPFDTRAYVLAVARQLRERESEALLEDRSAYFPDLLAAAESISGELRETVAGILSAPSAPLVATESIRDVRKRTARMALEYFPTLENATKAHLGDYEGARCVLGLADGALARESWDSMYVFGEELGVSDPYAASQQVDRFYDLLTRCREKREQAAAASAVAAASGNQSESEQAAPAWGEELSKKEQVIADLKATADERLRLLQAADADARQARAVSERLTEQLQEKVELIVALASSADERLCLVDQATADATNARGVADQLVAQLHEKDQLIATLAASADERLRLVDEATADASSARTALELLIAQLHEKDRLIAQLSFSAEQRLEIVNVANADASQARTVAEQLVAQLHEKDQLIAALSAAADERLRLLDEATTAVAREREATEALTAQLKAKERQIAQLTTAANERLRLAEQSSIEAERARARAEQYLIDLQAKQHVINELTVAAAERLDLIERLSQQLAQNGTPAEPTSWQ